MSVGIGGIPVVTDARSDEAAPIPTIKTFFNACATSDRVRSIIESRQFAPRRPTLFLTRDFKALHAKCRMLIPSYIKN